MNIINIIQQLKDTSSRNEKEAILLANKDNEILKKIFFLAYDPSIKFFIKKIPDGWQHDDFMNSTWESTFSTLEDIYSRKVTGNKALDLLTAMLNSIDYRLADIVCGIVKKDLECGVQKSTINKIWKGLVNDPPYMQYTLVNEKDLAKFKLPCYSEIKYDGLFADTFVSESCVEQSSRSGEALNIPLTEQTKQGLQQEFDGYVLHGEGLVVNEDGSFMSRQEGNGILNSSEAFGHTSMMVFWDCVTLEEYKAKVSTRPYSERRKFLEEKILKLKDRGCMVEVSDVRICETVEDIISHFIEARNKGEEGTVIKEFSLPWADKKFKQGIKLKSIFEVEARCTGVIPHKKNPNLIGALTYESEDGLIVGKVGSGLTDKLRKESPEYFVNKIFSLKGNDITKAEGKETESVFLPRFVEIRNDKTKANTREDFYEARDSVITMLRKVLNYESRK